MKKLLLAAATAVFVCSCKCPSGSVPADDFVDAVVLVTQDYENYVQGDETLSDFEKDTRQRTAEMLRATFEEAAAQSD